MVSEIALLCKWLEPCAELPVSSCLFVVIYKYTGQG